MSNMEEEDSSPLLAHGDDDVDGGGVKEPKKKLQFQDPVLDAIGEFGPYQAWLCFLGFLLNVVHSWLSLSLKFVGIKTDYTCVEGDTTWDTNAEGRDECRAFTGNSSRECSKWTYDSTQFRNTIVERWDLICERGGDGNIAQSVFFFGCLIGVFLAGLLADKLGRKPVCMGLLSTFILAGVLGGLTSSWPVWLVLRFVVGAASIGMVTVRYTIQVEMVGSSWRSWANTATSTGWVAGYMSLPVLAFILPDMRHMEVVIGLSGLPLLLLLASCHPESPRWLLAAGKMKAAVVVLNRAAAWNSLPSYSPSSSLPHPSSKSSKSSNSGLFTILSFPRQTRRLLLMSFAWFSFGMAYFGIALHTPEFGSSVFLVFFLGGLMDVPVLLFTPCLLNTVGRKPCLAGGLILGALCLILSALVPSGIFYKEWPVITLAIVGKVGIGLAFDTGYVWTSELFPTAVRNSCLSTCSSAARLGAIAAPILAGLGGEDHPALPMAVYGVISLVAGLTSLGLSPETMGLSHLPNTLEEGEKWGRRQETEEDGWNTQQWLADEWGEKVTPGKFP